MKKVMYKMLTKNATIIFSIPYKLVNCNNPNVYIIEADIM